MASPIFSFVDLETTGPNRPGHRIIEFALIQIQDGKEIYRFETLLNPERQIPPIITEITGLVDEDLVGAPSFDSVALHVKDCLDGTILMAHNVAFDHGFLKREFEALGQEVTVSAVCTVRLSRHFYPRHRKHNLDILIERHGFVCSNRHRAMGDAEVLVQLLAHLEEEFGKAMVMDAINGLGRGASVAADENKEKIEQISEKPGVYSLFGDAKFPLMIGSGANLREAVRKGMERFEKVKRIETERTAGEFGALFRRIEKAKQDLPVHSERVNRKKAEEALRESQGSWPKDKILLFFEDSGEGWGEVFAVFQWKILARAASLDQDIHWTFIAFPQFEFVIFEFFRGILSSPKKVRLEWISIDEWERLTYNGPDEH